MAQIGIAPPRMAEFWVREFKAEKDSKAVEENERRCSIGPRGKPSLVTDLKGDPIGRVRHFPAYIMLVAEYGPEKDIVGVISGCIKTVSKGRRPGKDLPAYSKVAYILGLRVSPSHRRLGIALKLIEKLEEWCTQKGAEYAYVATDKKNIASVNLFTTKCKYAMFRTPTILVNPVHAHYKPVSSTVSIIKLSPQLAESVYKRLFEDAEFFPKDIDSVIGNKLNLGTFMALPESSTWDRNASDLPPSFALLSVWNTKEVLSFQVKGVSMAKRLCAMGSRVLDTWLPWLRIPSIPNVFRPFGVYFLYGLHVEGAEGVGLMRRLCRFAHNLARDGGCGAVVAEVGLWDPVREGVPHWRQFSLEEDLWCIKKLVPPVTGTAGGGGGGGGTVGDWITSGPSSPALFVDPRDF